MNNKDPYTITDVLMGDVSIGNLIEPNSTIDISNTGLSWINDMGSNTLANTNNSSIYGGTLTISNNGTTGNSIYNPYTSYSDDTIAINKSSNALLVTGDANIDGNLKVKGKDICDILDKIEQRLAILKTDTELEERWERLKQLGDEYRQLEKDILEKEKIYKILEK